MIAPRAGDRNTRATNVGTSELDIRASEYIVTTHSRRGLRWTDIT